ncbi:MAG: FliM/FliN family flagellar motor switch protein [Acidobacteria bacterium]|nr:FliM/FliN family flagellar motor switch protein [Acidobacteriota bacterium]MBI3662995.1 FliM/FliN family flagellar motor switch protein [Acidobacteriota bacterium]
MSEENLNQSAPEIAEFRKVFGACMCHVLEQIAGAPFADAPAAHDPALAESGEYVRFNAAQKLTGELSFLVARADALRMAQALMSEPFEESVEFSSDHRDAMTELCRQFTGAAATQLKAKRGGEVELVFMGASRPEWTAVAQAGFELKSEKTPPITIHVLLSSELVASLRTAPQPAAVAPPPKAASAVAPEPPVAARPVAEAPASPVDKNIELLLDVELEVALRFGERQLMLREILELQNGAVIELEQQVQDPVELLVGGKVIAHGEVVIVDGNYGLRVTQILNPHQRLAALTQ